MIAHGYISPKENIEVEDVGNQICNELLLRSLIEPRFMDKSIAMHDLVHDLAISLMENKIPGVRSDRNIPIASTIREVNLVDRTILFPKQDLNISSISELTSVRVFYAKDDGLKDLSPSICNLKHLRYLNMSNSGIRSLPNSICTLWNLQILNLDRCYKLLALPRKLTSLYNLQHLCLSNCWSLSEMPSKMRKLTGLKTLSMFVVGAKKGTQLEELHCLNLSGELNIRHLERVADLDAEKANIADKKNLRRLTLSWERYDLSKLEEDDDKVLEALEPHSNLECLRIAGFRGRYLPRWMTNSTLENIVEVVIRNCACCRRLPKLRELTHLKKLELENIGVEYIIEEEVGSGNEVEIQFPTLEQLDLSKLPNLMNFSKEQESSREAFPNLKELSISRCSSFVLQPLPSLQKLDFLKCSSSTLALLSEQDIPRRLKVEIEESLTCFPIETLVKYSELRSLNRNIGKVQ